GRCSLQLHLLSLARLALLLTQHTPSITLRSTLGFFPDSASKASARHTHYLLFPLHQSISPSLTHISFPFRYYLHRGRASTRRKQPSLALPSAQAPFASP
uniref:Secreted protein n=1 Tax=Aegilops tauschii subsp. strangulata TaxID=200361 RepID=A0A453HH22_AEGTS